MKYYVTIDHGKILLSPRDMLTVKWSLLIFRNDSYDCG